MSSTSPATTTSDRRKNDEDIAVGVRRGLVQHLDRLAVQVHELPRVVKRLGRPPDGGRAGVEPDAASCAAATPSAARIGATGLMASGAARRREVAWPKSCLAGLRQRLVAADVVGIGPGIDDVANGLRCDPLDRGERPPGRWPPTRRPRPRRRPRPPGRRCSRRRRRSRRSWAGPPGPPGRPAGLLPTTARAAAAIGCPVPRPGRTRAAQAATAAAMRRRRLRFEEGARIIVPFAGTAERSTRARPSKAARVHTSRPRRRGARCRQGHSMELTLTAGEVRRRSLRSHLQSFWRRSRRIDARQRTLGGRPDVPQPLPCHCHQLESSPKT